MRNKLTIVGFGDSITEAVTGIPDSNKRWLNILKKSLEALYPDIFFNIINSGVGGNSDREKMLRLEKDVLSHKPDFILLEFGGNNNDFRKPERIVYPEQTTKYLEEINTKILAKTKIILITFPCIIEDLHAVYMCGQNVGKYFKYFSQFGGVEPALEMYRKKCREFAKKYNYPVINLDVLMRQDPVPERFTQQDGVHLTEPGNQLLTQCVLSSLKKTLEGQ